MSKRKTSITCDPCEFTNKKWKSQDSGNSLKTYSRQNNETNKTNSKILETIHREESICENLSDMLELIDVEINYKVNNSYISSDLTIDSEKNGEELNRGVSNQLETVLNEEFTCLNESVTENEINLIQSVNDVEINSEIAVDCQKIDVSTSTKKLEQQLKKKGIYEWTILNKTERLKSCSVDYSVEDGDQVTRAIQTLPVAQNWQHILSGLYRPSDFVSYDDKILIIKEAQPKGKFHYLIIPIENLRQVNELKPKDLDILNYMEEAAQKLIIAQKQNQEEFMLGFVAKPAMIVLKKQKFLWFHLHVLSKTPNFSYITLKKHWNLFNSKIFRTLNEVKHKLQTTGRIKTPTPKKCNIYLNGDLKCNSCDFEAKTLPTLKKHWKKEHSKRKRKTKAINKRS